MQVLVVCLSMHAKLMYMHVMATCILTSATSWCIHKYPTDCIVGCTLYGDQAHQKKQGLQLTGQLISSYQHFQVNSGYQSLEQNRPRCHAFHRIYHQHHLL